MQPLFMNTYVHISPESEAYQTKTSNMEQRGFWQYFPGKNKIASQMEQVQQAIIHEGCIEQLIRKISKYNLKLMKEKNKRNCSGKRNLEYVCSKRGRKHKIIPHIYHSMEASQSHHLFKI